MPVVIFQKTARLLDSQQKAADAGCKVQGMESDLQPRDIHGQERLVRTVSERSPKPPPRDGQVKHGKDETTTSVLEHIHCGKAYYTDLSKAQTILEQCVVSECTRESKESALHPTSATDRLSAASWEASLRPMFPSS